MNNHAKDLAADFYTLRPIEWRKKAALSAFWVTVKAPLVKYRLKDCSVLELNTEKGTVRVKASPCGTYFFKYRNLLVECYEKDKVSLTLDKFFKMVDRSVFFEEHSQDDLTEVYYLVERSLLYNDPNYDHISDLVDEYLSMTALKNTPIK